MTGVRMSTQVFSSVFKKRHVLQSTVRYCSKGRLSINNIFQGKHSLKNPITVQGWVKARREHRDVTFLNISDGSCVSPLQVILPTDSLPKDVTFGSCVEVTGTLQPSQGEQQEVEVVSNTVSVLGTNDAKEFPFKARKRHSADYAREFQHLRPRTNQFAALLRLRSAATHAIHQFFQQEGFCHIHTPVITSNDCEGGGEVFLLQPATPVRSSPGDKAGSFFDVPAYLTVSGQLHLEAVAGAFDKVYNFNPAFRAENSTGRHHLSEFYMVEAELSFTQSLEDLNRVIEQLLKSTTERLRNGHAEDFHLFLKHVAPEGHEDRLEKIIHSPYVRMTYTEAIDVLQKAKEKFEFRPEWGCDLQKEHERYLVSHCGHVPVFVLDFPKDIKPFYARENADATTAAAVDLLAPDVGELVGGSLREERYTPLKNKLEALGMSSEYEWYLDLRRFGSAPHGGFGLGFERYLQAILGISNIRDTILFPRWRNHCRT